MNANGTEELGPMVAQGGLPDKQDMPQEWRPVMLNPTLCKQILNAGERTYTDEEVKLITDLLWQWAQLTVDAYNELENS